MSTHSEDFLRLAAEAKKNILEVSPDEVPGLADRGALLLDVREKEEYQGSQHLLGALNLSRGVLEMRIHEYAVGKDAPIVCYCAGGNRGALAADSLRRLGYRNVSSIRGGLNACAPDLLEGPSLRKAAPEAGR